MVNRAMPPHPGKVLKEEFLEPLKLSRAEVARETGIPYVTLTRIVAGKLGLNADQALRLGRYFKNGERFWFDLQCEYEIRLAKRESWQEIKGEVAPILYSVVKKAAREKVRLED
jgi:addiction module HigA family antidote